jgi:hypothetical protein
MPSNCGIMKTALPGNTSASIGRKGDGKFHFREKKITVENF